MEAGLAGVCGQVVANRAVLGHKVDRAAVRTHHPEMEGKNAQEQDMASAFVTRILVQVKNPAEFFTDF